MAFNSFSISAVFQLTHPSSHVFLLVTVINLIFIASRVTKVDRLTFHIIQILKQDKMEIS